MQGVNTATGLHSDSITMEDEFNKFNFRTLRDQFFNLIQLKGKEVNIFFKLDNTQRCKTIY